MEKTDTTSTVIRWEGEHNFFISGTEHEDDSIHIISNADDSKWPLKLVLPTLCITYADIAFANAIGGVQADYPDSQTYGDEHFNPPVVLVQDAEIRKFTWIRGAKTVTIGPKETVIEWMPWNRLVIPKLRISAEAPVEALLKVPEVYISIHEPLEITVMQYTNGRHVGGVQVQKTHPDWRPVDKNTFGLWAQIVTDQTGHPIYRVHVTLGAWDDDESDYLTAQEWRTDKDGIIQASSLPCRLMKLSAVHDEYSPLEWEFRPFSGQEVKRIVKMSAIA